MFVYFPKSFIVYNETCILVSPISQREHEREFYENIIGLKCHYLFVQDLEEARLLVEMNRGFMPIEHAKITCARKHFEILNDGEYVYDVVETYKDLLDKVMK